MTWLCHKRHANQSKRQAGPGTNLSNASHLTFDKDIKNRCWKKDSPLNKWCQESLISSRRRKQDPFSLILHKNHLKMNELNVSKT